MAIQISGRGAVAEASLRTKPLLTSVNTIGEPKMTTSPPMPCRRLPTYHFGLGGKITRVLFPLPMTVNCSRAWSRLLR